MDWRQFIIESLIGLENIVDIQGDLILHYNDQLATLNGLENLQSINGDLKISDSWELSNLSGLEGLNAIGGSLDLYGNYYIESLTGIDNLGNIGGDLRISQSFDLVDISALSNLSEINGDLEIEGCFVLESLSGLDSIDHQSIDNLYLSSSGLSYCAVASICNYLENPSGTTVIQGNEEGCNSEEEVIEDCTVRTTEFGMKNGVELYPNPTSRIVNIRNLNPDCRYILKLYDCFGRLLLNKCFPHGMSEVQFDVGDYSIGIYTLVISSNSKPIQIEKVVITK